MGYDPYSKNLKCKWCGKRLMDQQTDLQCDPCWEVITRLDYALAIPSLFEWIKCKVDERIVAQLEKEEEEHKNEVEIINKMEWHGTPGAVE